MATSVIVDDLNVSRTGLRPDKADTKLVVDPDTELSLSVSSQGFEVV